MSKFSFGAELHLAPKKRFAETILFIPFYGGKKPQIRRHIDFANELGFDAVDVEIDTRLLSFPNRVFSSHKGLGYKHVWADQVEQLLNEIPDQKIVFAFSNPSSGAIEAIGRRRAVDVKGLICDGGPTAHYWNSLVKYYTTETPLPIAPARWAAATMMTPLWSMNARATLNEDLTKFPQNFPILSIRGWKDHLIPPKDIDEVFEPHLNLAWRKLSLPEAGHLNGLRDFPEEYIPPVTDFLKEIATPFKASKR